MPDIRNDGPDYDSNNDGGVRKPGNKSKLDAAKERAERRIAAHPQDFAPGSDPRPESEKIGGTRAKH